ncbi:Expanded,-like protein [Daphnia magna]|uniref:Expanded,-like protein n=1 Tax=Daphnia magna TaxID=35525 RepID=A0A162CGZ3_9CRUS|nr:Expanded,-like protein [Daphnia magna]
MRHPPVLLRPAAAQTADPAPIATSSVSASQTTVPSTTANGNSSGLQHLYSNTGANHHPSLPCSSTLHSSYTSSAGGGGGVSANSNNSISDNVHVVGHQSVNPTTPTPVTGGPASAFSGSAHSLIGPLLPSARRYVAVRLLTGETLQFDVEVKSKGKELYAAVARHMSSLGMKSTDIFGLAIQIDGEYLFVDPENKLGKYAPKGWKSSHASGLNNAGHPLLVLYFRVKFYVDSHLLISIITTNFERMCSDTANQPPKRVSSG